MSEQAHDREKASKTMLIVAILVSVTLAAVAQLLLKQGMDSVVQGKLGGAAFSPGDPAALKAVATTWMVWLGLVVFGLSAIVWLAVLSRASLSFAYPFAALTYVLIVGFDKLVLHEAVPGARWAGVALIIGGIVLVSRGPTT